MPHRAALVALALALLAPAATAADALRVRGEVRLDAPLHLAGGVEVSTAEGALDLAPVLLAGLALDLVADEARGEVVTYSRTNLGAHVSDPEARREVLRMGPARLTNFTCDRCILLLHATGGDSRVVLDGVADGPLAWTRDARTYAAYSRTTSDPAAYVYEAAPGWLQASPDPALRDAALPLASAAAGTRGETRLLVQWAAFDLVQENGTRHVDTRKRAHDGPGAAAGLALGARSDYAYVLLTLRGARVEAAPDAPLVLLAPDALVRLDGSLATSRATGRLDASGERVALRDEPLEADGAFDLRPVADADGARVRQATVLGGERASLALEGDATRLRAAGLAHDPPFPAPPAPALAALAALALAALLAKLLWLPLYTRLSRTHLLAHPRRARILASLEAHPGQGALDLSRATGISRVVVRHHLGMLARHGLVVTREEGRRARYYLPGAGPAAALGDALAVPTRRRLAHALLEAGGRATQKELSQRTGVAERLVSYHLAHLARLGLVAHEGPRPRRYAAAAALAEALGRGGPGAP